MSGDRDRDYWGAGAINEGFRRVDEHLESGSRRMARLEGRVDTLEDERDATADIPNRVRDMLDNNTKELRSELTQLRQDFREDLRDAVTGKRWRVAQWVALIGAALALVGVVTAALINAKVIG